MRNLIGLLIFAFLATGLLGGCSVGGSVRACGFAGCIGLSAGPAGAPQGYYPQAGRAPHQVYQQQAQDDCSGTAYGSYGQQRVHVCDAGNRPTLSRHETALIQHVSDDAVGECLTDDAKWMRPCTH